MKERMVSTSVMGVTTRRRRRSARSESAPSQTDPTTVLLYVVIFIIVCWVLYCVWSYFFPARVLAVDDQIVWIAGSADKDAKTTKTTTEPAAKDDDAENIKTGAVQPAAAAPADRSLFCASAFEQRQMTMLPSRRMRLISDGAHQRVVPSERSQMDGVRAAVYASAQSQLAADQAREPQSLQSLLPNGTSPVDLVPRPLRGVLASDIGSERSAFTSVEQRAPEPPSSPAPQRDAAAAKTFAVGIASSDACGVCRSLKNDLAAHPDVGSSVRYLTEEEMKSLKVRAFPTFFALVANVPDPSRRAEGYGGIDALKKLIASSAPIK